MRAAARARIDALHAKIAAEIAREKIHILRQHGVTDGWMPLYLAPAEARCDVMALPPQIREQMVWTTTSRSPKSNTS